ncbi:MAG: YtfJ family protein [Halioglobus sp.]
MNIRFLLVCFAFIHFSAASHAQTPALSSPLPTLSIADRGQLIAAADDYSYAPWDSSQNPNKTHVLQYFAGTVSDKKTFEPFTDLLQTELNHNDFHVTTIVNLDAALWGTTGFVISEVKGKKDEFPMATMVVDTDGLGEQTWALGKKGAILVVLDTQGVVQFVTREAMDESTITSTLELMRTLIKS